MQYYELQDNIIFIVCKLNYVFIIMVNSLLLSHLKASDIHPCPETNFAISDVNVHCYLPWKKCTKRSLAQGKILSI